MPPCAARPLSPARAARCVAHRSATMRPTPPCMRIRCPVFHAHAGGRASLARAPSAARCAGCASGSRLPLSRSQAARWLRPQKGPRVEQAAHPAWVDTRQSRERSRNSTTNAGPFKLSLVLGMPKHAILLLALIVACALSPLLLGFERSRRMANLNDLQPRNFRS